jgi:hypothetical protein
MSRRAAARTVAAVLALVSLTVGFGAVDLLSPWILREGTQVSDVGYGTLAGLLIPVGLLAQTRRPALNIAGLQQVALAALAYLAAGALTGQRPLLAAGAVVAAAAATVATLHPARRRLLRMRRRPSLPLLALALAAAAPGSQYALHMAFNQRDRVLPADAHLGLGHWAALSAAAFAALLAALLTSFRAPGFTIPGLTAAAAVLAWAVSCLAYPHSAGALGPAWAALAIAWALAFAGATLRARRPRADRDRRPSCGDKSWGQPPGAPGSLRAAEPHARAAGEPADFQAKRHSTGLFQLTSP